MSLLELENGDPENLEGRVIVYGYSPPEEEAGEPQDQISAMFCTTDPSDFTEKFGVPEGGLEELAQRAGDVLGWVASGELKLRIGHEYSLSDAPEAHRQLESRATTGKVLLIP